MFNHLSFDLLGLKRFQYGGSNLNTLSIHIII